MRAAILAVASRGRRGHQSLLDLARELHLAPELRDGVAQLRCALGHPRLESRIGSAQLDAGRPDGDEQHERPGVEARTIPVRDGHDLIEARLVGLLDGRDLVVDAAVRDLLHPPVHRGYLARNGLGVRDERRQQRTLVLRSRALSRPQCGDRVQVFLAGRFIADQVVGEPGLGDALDRSTVPARGPTCEPQIDFVGGRREIVRRIAQNGVLGLEAFGSRALGRHGGIQVSQRRIELDVDGHHLADARGESTVGCLQVRGGRVDRVVLIEQPETFGEYLLGQLSIDDPHAPDRGDGPCVTVEIGRARPSVEHRRDGERQSEGACDQDKPPAARHRPSTSRRRRDRPRQGREEGHD